MDEFQGAIRTLATLDNFLLVGSTDNTCKIYEYDEETNIYKQTAYLHNSKEYIYSTLIVKQGDQYRFIFAGKDKSIYIVTKTGELIKEIEKAHNGPICSITSNSKYFVTGSWDSTAKVWDLETFENVKVIECEEFAHAVTTCVLSNDVIVAASQKMPMNFWSCKDFYKVKRIGLAHDDITRKIKELPGYSDGVNFASCSND